MKRKQISILSFVILSLFVFIFYFTSKENTEIKKEILQKTVNQFTTRKVKNAFIDYELSASGKICELPKSDIKFEISGELLNGDPELKEGDEFKKNQLLFRINNTDAFSILAEKKGELSLLFKSLIPQIESKFAKEKEKWLIFLDEIKPTKRLPDFPSLFPPEERIFLVENGFMQAYVKTNMLENQMEKYFYLAPFDGKFLKSTISAGKIVDAGTAIATISEKTELLAQIYIKKENLKIYKNQKYVHLMNKNGREIGNGELLRFSKKKKKNDNMEVFYSIQEKRNSTLTPGTRLKIIIKHTTTDKCVAIPYSAIQENTVRVFENDKSISKTVTIIGKTANHYFVVGLADGEQLILNEF